MTYSLPCFMHADVVCFSAIFSVYPTVSWLSMPSIVAILDVCTAGEVRTRIVGLVSLPLSMFDILLIIEYITSLDFKLRMMQFVACS